MVKRLSILLLSFLGVLLLPLPGFAEPKFYVEVHPNYGTMDDAYIFSVVLENGEDANGAPLLTGGVDFNLSLIGPQSSVRIINGAVTRKIIYNYQLIPKREGILTTPSAEVTVAGQKLTAEALSVTVKGKRAEPLPASNNEYFMRQSLDASEHVFVGQQLAHTLEIFTRVTILDPQLGDFTFPDFRNDQVGEQETSQRYVNGVPFTVTVLRRALFPLKPGTIEIPARELKARVRMRGRSAGGPFPFDSMDPFDPSFMDDFFSQGKLMPVVLKSNPLQVVVDPLPPVPADLPLLGLDSPPVGPTTIRLQYDPSEIKFGETKTVTVNINSSGLIQNLKGLGIKSSPSLRVYEETPQTKPSIQGNKLWTTKTIKLSLVPLAGGTVTLPPFEIGYFDPETRSYALAKTDPVRFEVTGGPAAPTPQPTPPPSQGRSSSTTAVSSPSSAPAAAATPDPMRYSEPTALDELKRQVTLPLALLAVGSLLAVIFAVWVGTKIRASFAPRRAMLESVNASRDPAELSTALRSALQRRYPQLGQHFSREELRRAVSNSDLLYEAEALLDRCDSALFGGKDIDTKSLRREAAAFLKKL